MNVRVLWGLVKRTRSGGFPVRNVLQSQPLADGWVLIETDIDDAELEGLRLSGNMVELPLEAGVGELSKESGDLLKLLSPQVQDADRVLVALRRIRNACGVPPEFMKIEHRG